MIQVLNTLMLVGGALLALVIVLLSLPSSKLRDFALQLIGWSLSAASVAYIVLPFDLLPDFIPGIGLFDDGGALVTAIGGVVMALAGSNGKAEKS